MGLGSEIQKKLSWIRIQVSKWTGSWIRTCNNGIIVVYLSFIDIIFIFQGPGTKGQKD
jgi:hypothetical protein